MTEIIKKQLKEKIDNLFKIYQGLKNLQRFTLKDLKENIENVWSVTFGLVAGIEAILDISQYVLADKRIKIESYGKIPEKLQEISLNQFPELKKPEKPIQDETADWKTYRNEEYGFEVKYPKDWYIYNDDPAKVYFQRERVNSQTKSRYTRLLFVIS